MEIISYGDGDGIGTGDGTCTHISVRLYNGGGSFIRSKIICCGHGDGGGVEDGTGFCGLYNGGVFNSDKFADGEGNGNCY